MATELVTSAGLDVPRLQRRTLGLLAGSQVVGGIGVATGLTVGALLAEEVAGTALSGLAISAGVVGAALLAVPVSRIMRAAGRRPGLALAYLVGALGAVLVVVATVIRSVPLLFLGMLLFGGGTTANLQTRYAAIDLADPARRARQLSLIVWVTTVGAVAAPNLAPLADRLGTRLDLPPLAGAFAVSAVANIVAAVLVQTFLRPDPLLTAQRLTAPTAAPASAAEAVPAVATVTAVPANPVAVAVPEKAVTVPEKAVTVPESAAPPGVGRPSVGGGQPRRADGMGAALRVIRDRPAARLGMAAVAVGHLVMVAVMVMTPLRLHETHGDADVLRVVGVVLSLHVAGMYALSPVVGLLADRFGRRRVIVGGLAMLLAACAVAGSAGHNTLWLAIGLTMLGLGWSGTMVAGSALLTEAVPAAVRPATQGLSDLTMGLAGALAGALSGFVVHLAGYPVLTALAALAAVPLLALALRPVPPVAADDPRRE
ncbi:MFS transporter [Plantactinospora sp. GCM10030261]|uniref:MFS transporter n=1 Tax=Plantactinospora sp. GCM10030261 TaxID=3273420 RepID=UPI003610FE49